MACQMHKGGVQMLASPSQTPEEAEGSRNQTADQVCDQPYLAKGWLIIADTLIIFNIGINTFP